jgi:hypothetical protein
MNDGITSPYQSRELSIRFRLLLVKTLGLTPVYVRESSRVHVAPREVRTNLSGTKDETR